MEKMDIFFFFSNSEKTNSKEKECPKQKSKETGMGGVRMEGRSLDVWSVLSQVKQDIKDENWT